MPPNARRGARNASLWLLLATGCATGTGRGADGGSDAAPADASNDTGPGDAGSETGTAPGSDAGFDGQIAGDAGSCAPVSVAAVPDCTHVAPPDSFELRTEWTWDGLPGFHDSVVIPLVANLTDDNGDGRVDLCDSPDVVVTVADRDLQRGHVVILDGATGAEHGRSSLEVTPTHTPAIADLDGDGRPEVLAVDVDRHLIALDSSGATRWSGDTLDFMTSYAALAVGNLDAEGGAEVVVGNQIFDATGTLLRVLPDVADARGQPSVAVLADLDEDGDLEVVLGRSAYQHDGSPVYELKDALPVGSVPLVADLDMDDAPEVLLSYADGLALLEADGALVFQAARPLAAPAAPLTWKRPASVADINADGSPEILLSAGSEYAAMNPSLDVLWAQPIQDESGAAAGTAFDFLGDGSAEAIYADERQLFIFDASGSVLLQAPRSSRTFHEYPVVADIDDDGSAEILVVSSTGFDGQRTAATLQVFGDAKDRWIQARRIWNQHTYHVTNVEEDSKIPVREMRHWEGLNTFRVNAAIEGNRVCTPVLQ